MNSTANARPTTADSSTSVYEAYRRWEEEAEKLRELARKYAEKGSYPLAEELRVQVQKEIAAYHRYRLIEMEAKLHGQV